MKGGNKKQMNKYTKKKIGEGYFIYKNGYNYSWSKNKQTASKYIANRIKLETKRKMQKSIKRKAKIIQTQSRPFWMD